MELYDELEKKLIWEDRELHNIQKLQRNELSNLKGKIRVHIRLKPLPSEVPQ